jgi:hypothetical protein
LFRKKIGRLKCLTQERKRRPPVIAPLITSGLHLDQ